MRITHRGLTLIETVISVCIMVVMIVMALGTFISVVKIRRTADLRLQGTGLANQLMAEIVQNSYRDPAGGTGLGPDAGETTRANYDDVDDYNNYLETTLAYKDGTAISGLSGWTRQVTVAWADPTSLAIAGSETNLKLITVTVTDPQGVKTVITSLRSATGAFDQSPGHSVTAVRWVGVELQSGTDSKAKLASGTSVSAIAAGP
jgi:MSHA pilin protein MshD